MSWKINKLSFPKWKYEKNLSDTATAVDWSFTRETRRGHTGAEAKDTKRRKVSCVALKHEKALRREKTNDTIALFSVSKCPNTYLLFKIFFIFLLNNQALIVHLWGPQYSFFILSSQMYLNFQRCFSLSKKKKVTDIW